MTDTTLQDAAESPIGRMMLLDRPMMAGLTMLGVMLARKGLLDRAELAQMFDVMRGEVREDLLGQAADPVRSAIDALREMAMGAVPEQDITT